MTRAVQPTSTAEATWVASGARADDPDRIHPLEEEPTVMDPRPAAGTEVLARVARRGGA